MTFVKLEIILLSLAILVCASTVRLTSRDASSVGYLYNKPEHSLEEGVKDVKEEGEGKIETKEENSNKSLQSKEEMPEEYLEPKNETRQLKGRKNAKSGKVFTGKDRKYGRQHHGFL